MASDGDQPCSRLKWLLRARPEQIGPSSVEYAPARSILTESSGFIDSFDFTLNPYSGCTFGCSYCYAAAFVRDQERREHWGQWVRVKENALELLRKQRRKPLDGAAIYLSSVTDPYQPIERKFGPNPRDPRRACDLPSGAPGRADAQPAGHARPRPARPLHGGAGEYDHHHRRRGGAQSLRARLRVNRAAAPAIPRFSSGPPDLHHAHAAAACRRSAGFAERLKATGVQRFVTQYLHAERGQFVAGTRAAAVALCRERGWNEAAYRRTVDVLRAALPHLDEGRDGFVPM